MTDAVDNVKKFEFETIIRDHETGEIEWQRMRQGRTIKKGTSDTFDEAHEALGEHRG